MHWRTWPMAGFRACTVSTRISTGARHWLRSGIRSARFLVWDTPLPVRAPVGPGRRRRRETRTWAYRPNSSCTRRGRASPCWVLRWPGAGWRLSATSQGGSWTPLLIALNPLLLVEGAGSGHNDIVMVALLLWAAVMSIRNHAVGAAIVVGLAVAIKPVALLAVPLVVVAHVRPSAGLSTALRVTTLLALTLMPTFVLSLPFGGPAVLARAIVSRAAVAHAQTPLMVAGALTAACAYGLWRMHQALGRTPAAWIDAWVPLAMAVAVVAVPLNFPWYLTWAAVPALTLPGRHGLGAVVVTTVVGVILMWRYTIPL